MSAPRTGVHNMAIDHALLEQVKRDQRPVLRLYQWRPACLSFGRNQPTRGLYDTSAAAALGIDIVRRPTGGAAVLHAQELTYSFIAPLDLFGGPRASYFAINRALVSGLQRVGVPAELSDGVKRSPFGTMHPCFAEPAAGEVVVNGMKLVGSAQRCEQRTLLQHGSILLDGTQDAVAAIARVPFILEGRATTLREILGAAPAIGDLTVAVAEAFAEEAGMDFAPEELEDLSGRVAELAMIYASPEWTWRR